MSFLFIYFTPMKPLLAFFLIGFAQSAWGTIPIATQRSIRVNGTVTCESAAAFSIKLMHRIPSDPRVRPSKLAECTAMVKSDATSGQSFEMEGHLTEPTNNGVYFQVEHNCPDKDYDKAGNTFCAKLEDDSSTRPGHNEYFIKIWPRIEYEKIFMICPNF